MCVHPRLAWLPCLGLVPRLEFSAFIVFDTRWRYTGLVGSGVLSLPGTGNGPFGRGSTVPGGIPKLVLKKSGKVAGVVANAELTTEIGLFRSCCSIHEEP